MGEFANVFDGGSNRSSPVGIPSELRRDPLKANERSVYLLLIVAYPGRMNMKKSV